MHLPFSKTWTRIFFAVTLVSVFFFQVAFGSKIVKLRISSSPYAPKDEDLSYFTKAVCTAFNAVR